MARLKEEYKKTLFPDLMRKLKCKNPHQVPKLEKVVVNMGVGGAVQDSKLLEEAKEHLATITGQRPILTKARKSIAAFKLRKGKHIGCKVTLRGNIMYEFLDRLINFAIPRVRDFRGLSPDSFDRDGNYSFGVTEQLIFTEIAYEKVKHTFGMDITMCIKSECTDDSRELLRAFGMPFKKDIKSKKKK